MFTFNRVFARSALLSAVAAGGIFYELLKVTPPRWPLIGGYVVVIGLSIYGMVNRPAVRHHDKTLD